MTPIQKEMMEEITTGAIERLKALPQPVVRVSGPITSGGFGYDENLKRFIRAQEILREKGFTVFDYFEDNDDEDVIKEHDLQEFVMEYYHQPILQTGLISAVYMMPKWEESGGATAERKHFEPKV
tara:strand:- start:1846 stop:2220 length:375 start_codon:yes stop_codon:yes gene_type:complete